MKISNDHHVKSKIALLSIAVFIVANLVQWIFLGNDLALLCILVSGLTFYGAVMLFRHQIKKIVTDVNLTEESILYTKNNKTFEVFRSQILKIGDSGLNSAPHEIIIFLNGGETVEFFPDKKYGGFYRGELKKMLQSWLIRDR